MLGKEILARLQCPQHGCRGPLTERPDGYACPRCALLFPLRDGIPDFVIDNAQPLPRDEATAAKAPA